MGVSGRAAKRSGTRHEATLRFGWVLSIFVVQGFTQIWVNLPGRFDLLRTLPLHICDIVPWIGAAALLGASRWTRSLTFFWGFGLSIWAFVVPELNAGPANLEFWLFWIGHTQIIATAAYLCFVDEFRPTAQDFRVTALCTILYAVVVVPIDVLISANYGSFGRSSAVATLGPWPARIPVLVLVEILIFLALAAPWLLSARNTTTPVAPTGSTDSERP